MRLADSSVAALDTCSCGVLHLHIGGLTVRLTRPSILELLDTLSRGVAHDATLRPHPSLRRGDA